MSLSDSVSVDASEISTMPEGVIRCSFGVDTVGSNPDQSMQASSMTNKHVWIAAMTFLYIFVEEPRVAGSLENHVMLPKSAF